MGRYRPPQPAGSKYITPEGRLRLADELDYLWHKRRPAVTKALTAAAAEGDRSENAEYIYRKKELREIDARVRFLRKRLDGIIVVDRKPDDEDKVYFGAWVRLSRVRQNATQHEQSIYRIVGPDEFDPKLGYISMDSPMGKSLLGKSLGDEFGLKLSEQENFYTILEVSYSRIQ